MRLLPFLLKETLLLEAMFEIPGSDIVSVHVTEDCVNGKCDPMYIHASQASWNVRLETMLLCNSNVIDNPQNADAAEGQIYEEELGQAQVGRGWFGDWHCDPDFRNPFPSYIFWN